MRRIKDIPISIGRYYGKRFYVNGGDNNEYVIKRLPDDRKDGDFVNVLTHCYIEWDGGGIIYVKELVKNYILDGDWIIKM